MSPIPGKNVLFKLETIMFRSGEIVGGLYHDFDEHAQCRFSKHPTFIRFQLNEIKMLQNPLQLLLIGSTKTLLL